MRFYDEQRIGAVLSAKHKLPIQIHLHTVNPEEKYPSYSYSKRLVRQREEIIRILEEDKPDALIGWSSGDYWALKEAGVQIPRDLGYAALVAEEACSGMEISRPDLWKIELDRVIELIRNQEFGRPKKPIVSLLTPDFIDRGTA